MHGTVKGLSSHAVYLGACHQHSSHDRDAAQMQKDGCWVAVWLGPHACRLNSEAGVHTLTLPRLTLRELGTTALTIGQQALVTATVRMAQHACVELVDAEVRYSMHACMSNLV